MAAARLKVCQRSNQGQPATTELKPGTGQDVEVLREMWTRAIATDRQEAPSDKSFHCNRRRSVVSRRWLA